MGMGVGIFFEGFEREGHLPAVLLAVVLLLGAHLPEHLDFVGYAVPDEAIPYVCFLGQSIGVPTLQFLMIPE